jgi:hypothetical protein
MNCAVPGCGRQRISAYVDMSAGAASDRSSGGYRQHGYSVNCYIDLNFYSFLA